MFEAPTPGYELLARLMMMHQQAQQGGFGMMPAAPMPQAPMGQGGMPMPPPQNGQPQAMSPLYTALSGRLPLQGQ
jgi:hypothetical protein